MEEFEHDFAAKPHEGWRHGAVAHLAAMKRMISDLARRSARQNEIAALDRAGMLNAVLDDLGLTRWELNKSLRGYPESERLLDTMAYHLGVELEKLDARTLYALRHACALCDAHRLCRHWLGEGAPGEPAFCPNAAIFDGVSERGQGI